MEEQNMKKTDKKVQIIKTRKVTKLKLYSQKKIKIINLNHKNSEIPNSESENKIKK